MRQQGRLPFPNPTDGPTFAEFFAGIGLMRMGLERCGWRVAFANDISRKKQSLYESHFRDTESHFVAGDVNDIDPNDVPPVDLATASFPCTDLSLAGGRAGLHRGESSTFWAFCRVLEGMGADRPSHVLLENVTGFLTSDGGRDFAQALRALNSLGYRVDPFVLDARSFVPQSRPRLFVVGERDCDGAAGPSLTESRLRPRAVVDFIEANPDIDWAIAEAPEPPAACDARVSDVLENLPPDSPEWWSSERVEYLYNQMSDRHRQLADVMIRGRRYSYGTVFRRVRAQPGGGKRSMAELRTDGIAGCLRTPKGGSGRQIVFRGGHRRMAARLLTARECARLMGADDFRLDGVSLNDALFGFGDAVCVPAVEWVARHRLPNALPRVSREQVATSA